MVRDTFLKNFAEHIQANKVGLVIVDVQNDFCHPEGAFSRMNCDLSHIQNALENLVPFINGWRSFGLPVILVKTIHGDWSNSPSWQRRLGGILRQNPVCLSGSWGSEFCRITATGSDYVVIKHRFSSFLGTDLDLVLKSRGIETIVTAGVATNVCVESTIRDAVSYNYNVVIIEDCCGAFSSSEHGAALQNIRKYFGVVMTSVHILEILRNLETGHSMGSYSDG